MIILDGSQAGGQYLRTSLSLSAITKKPFKLINIRGKRENPGLQNQHLTAVNAMKELCNGEVNGNELHSKELEFIPKQIEGGNYIFDTGTAGSVTLVMQTILPVLLFANKESQIGIKGGTANPFAPPALEIKEVFIYFLKKFGIEVDFEIIQEGFYPKGGGKIIFKVKPIKNLKKINLIERGELIKNKVSAISTDDLRKAQVSARLIAGFKEVFKKEITNEEQYVNTLSPGCYLHANAEFTNTKLGFTVLGEKGKKAEDVGKECALHFSEIINSNATVDHFTADQLLIYVALAGEGSFITNQITDHLKTNAELIEKFLPVKFEIKDNKIECKKS
ncbi:MAG: RNA 3'-terminal phosphate cyclase [Candidatus Nanoarchaeia archaeon]